MGIHPKSLPNSGCFFPGTAVELRAKFDEASMNSMVRDFYGPIVSPNKAAMFFGFFGQGRGIDREGVATKQ